MVVGTPFAILVVLGVICWLVTIPISWFCEDTIYDYLLVFPFPGGILLGFLLIMIGLFIETM